MGPEIEVEYVNVMRQFVLELPGGIMSRWALFAGCGVASRPMEALRVFRRKQYGIQFVPGAVLMSDHHVEKHKRLMEQFDCPFIAAEANNLAGEEVKDIRRVGHEPELLR